MKLFFHVETINFIYGTLLLNPIGDDIFIFSEELQNQLYDSMIHNLLHGEHLPIKLPREVIE